MAGASANHNRLTFNLSRLLPLEVGDRQWLLTELMGEEAIVELQSVNVTIKLSDLYKRVQFETSSENTED